MIITNSCSEDFVGIQGLHNLVWDFWMYLYSNIKTSNH